MKIMTRPINITKETSVRRTGSWSKVIQTRKRKGLHFDTDLYVSAADDGYQRRPDALLRDVDLWQAYRRCGDIRSSIDSIVRRVATFDWMVTPNVSPQDPRYDELQKHCDHVASFLERPNKNGDTWQEIMTAVLTDTLVFDVGCLELVYSRNGKLQELVPLRGSTVFPIVDEHGKLLKYVQNIYADGNAYTTMAVADTLPQFTKKQIMFLSLFRNTASPSGNPIIETMVNECIALLRATEHAMLNLDADEIPPGILVLAGIAGRAAEEAKSDLQMLKGQDHKIRVMTTPDPSGMGAQWLELKRTPKDMAMREIIDDIRRSIFRAFGVMPVEMGLTDGIPKSTATVQMDVASSHLVTPTLELIQARINAQILPAIIDDTEILSLIKFQFDREARLSPTDQKSMAETHRTYISHGILTRNEVREYLGLKPIEGGDLATIETPIGPISVDQIATLDYEKKPEDKNETLDKKEDINSDKSTF